MTSESLKKTPLCEACQKAGGKMVDFHGWFLPVQFNSIIAEHKSVREKAGMFDVSHMGQVFVEGPEAWQFLQYINTNNINEKPLILSMGGSLGARTINEAMVDVIARLQPEHKYRFIHATGKFGTWVPDKLKEKGVDLTDKDIEIREYINNMDVCMSAADIIIGRSGASTLSELQATGSASILIPSPNVTENHQYHNAMALVNKGAAAIIEEKDLTGEALTNKLVEILSDENKLSSMRKNAKEMAILDSTDRIIKIIEDTIR